VGRTRRPGGAEALEASDAVEVDAVEHHLELTGGRPDAGAGGRVGER
jgi:hypothetical protein